MGSRIQASFGAPPCIGSGSIDAIRAAFQIIGRGRGDSLIERLRNYEERLSIAIGIATGKCLTGRFGGVLLRRWMSLGAPVERADALCAAANSGEILIDEQTITDASKSDPSLGSIATLRWRDPDRHGVYAL